MQMDDKEMFEQFLAFKQFQEDNNVPVTRKKKKQKYNLRSDGYYCTQITVGFDDETGKRNRKTVYAKTIPELDNSIAQIRVDLLNGKKIHNERVSFSQYSQKWLKQRKPFLEYKTYVMYESVLKLYCTSINQMEMKDITKSDIQGIINDNIDKPRTCQQIQLTIKQVFEYALDDDLIYKNPVRKLEMPKYTKPEKRALTKHENLLSDVTEFTDQEKAYILLIKWCGLRKEEVLALTRNDFDFEKDTISINKAVTFTPNKPLIKSTKTSSSIRVLPILKVIRAFLEYYIGNLSSQWLFVTQRTGEPITSQSFKRMWESIIKKMKIKARELKFKDCYELDLTSHTFRHNYASMLYKVGVNPKEAQYLLGHASINMTMDVYTHIDIDDLQVTTLLKQSN